jgi:hypothetical protein
MKNIKTYFLIILSIRLGFAFSQDESMVSMVNDRFNYNIKDSSFNETIWTFNKRITFWIGTGSEWRYKNSNYAKYIGNKVGVYSSNLELANSLNPILNFNLYYQIYQRVFLNSGINISRIYYGKAYVIGEFNSSGWEHIYLTTFSGNIGISKTILFKRKLFLTEVNCYISFYKSLSSVLLKSYQGVYSRTLFSTFKLGYRIRVGNSNTRFILPFIEFPILDKYGLKNKQFFNTEGNFFWWVLGVNIKIF